MIPGASLGRIMQYVRHYPEFHTLGELREHMQLIFAPFGIRLNGHWDHMVRHGHIKTPSNKFALAYDPKISHAIIEATKDIYDDMNLWEVWEQVQSPTLIIRGEKSDILPKEVVEQMCQKVQVESVELKNIGHAPALMDHEQIKLVIDWL